MLSDVMAEFTSRLTGAYGSLVAIRDQVVLDIACFLIFQAILRR